MGVCQRGFRAAARLIYDESGINLSPDKKTMLEIRLRRRLHSLNIASCAEYCDYLFSPDGQEAANWST